MPVFLDRTLESAGSFGLSEILCSFGSSPSSAFTTQALSSLLVGVNDLVFLMTYFQASGVILEVFPVFLGKMTCCGGRVPLLKVFISFRKCKSPFGKDNCRRTAGCQVTVSYDDEQWKSLYSVIISKSPFTAKWPKNNGYLSSNHVMKHRKGLKSFRTFCQHVKSSYFYWQQVLVLIIGQNIICKNIESFNRRCSTISTSSGSRVKQMA